MLLHNVFQATPLGIVPGNGLGTARSAGKSGSGIGGDAECATLQLLEHHSRFTPTVSSR